MMRTLYITLALAVAIGISAVRAQTNGQPNSKVQSMTGVVKTVVASSLTLEIGDQVTVRYRQSGSALTAMEVRVVQK